MNVDCNSNLQASHQEAMNALKILAMTPGQEDLATVLVYLVQRLDSLEKDGR